MIVAKPKLSSSRAALGGAVPPSKPSNFARWAVHGTLRKQEDIYREFACKNRQATHKTHLHVQSASALPYRKHARETGKDTE